ncbi:MAG TPA: transketolase C-terminal domain-containing protein [Verrucomicrobiota bacterium]|nr:transketolase [Verrucomicrobiales bacterium]HRI13987.1 transketolase C-terminal domain-containing protein [Verrucomicrobiota bacterium]
MAADTSVVAKIELPALTPLTVKSRLAATPARGPKYSVTVKNATGQNVVLGDPRATRALVALMDVHAVTGGAACHWGGPAAFAEVNAAIHGIMFATTGRPWFDAFNFVNDAGHTENGIYALRANYGFDGLTFEDLKAFRSVRSKLTGHGESHLNPEGVLLSNGPLGSALPQAQGLALGDHLAQRDRVTIVTISDGASMEGEAKEAFAAIPGLAGKGRLNPFVLVVSDNDTKLSGRITHDAFSMHPTFEAMADLGWDVRHVTNGHDLPAVYLAVERAVTDAKASPTKPVCLILKTIKGYGIKATEENSTGGHGFPLSNGEKIPAWIAELYQGDTPPAEFVSWAASLRADWEKKEAEKKAKAAATATQSVPAAPAVKKDKVQAGLAAGAIRAAKEGYPVFSVSADVQGSTGISTFQKATGNFIEVGIAESNMISTGAGLSKAGFIPIVDTFGQFGVTKGNLPLTMAALSQAPVIAMFSHIGFQDAADGASHQATTYLAAVSAIPHTIVIAPSCANEADAFMYAAIKHVGDERRAGRDGESVIFFVGRENYPVEWIPGATYAWGRAQIIQEGSEVVLIGCGVLFSKCLEAAKLLAAQGKSATVINNPFINRVDVETIGAAVKRCGGRVVTIEDHQAICGMGAQVSHALSQAGIAHRIKSLAIHGEFGQSAYLAEELYVKHGLTGPKMAEAALALLG